MKNKKFFGDFALNLIASGVTTAVTQLLLFPLLAKIYSAETYGIILTISGIANTIIAAFGNSLNNTRLVVESDYQDKGTKGDFLPILYGCSALGIIIIVVYLAIGIRVDAIVIMLIAIFVLAGIWRNYGNVAFRLKLNYKFILLLNIGIAGGNIIGIILLHLLSSVKLWPIPFIIGELCGVIFISSKSGIFKEPIVRTELFSLTISKELILLLTTLAGNILVYLDRLLLLPLLGGEAVSTYTVAAFFGKSLGILLTPMSGVFLSYFAQKDYVMSRKRFWKINFGVAIISLAFYLFSLIASRTITGFIYPTIIDQAKPYLRIANLAAIITITANMTQPSVLKFAKTYWQIIIQVIYCIVYLGIGAIGAKENGIMGFAVAALVAAIIRLIMLYAVGNFSLHRG